ncbi:hypothetical protein [Labedaea rhizosphaerae]|uniref:hypothetical protein n=1 Tax=Labedaea rhizosphaerae TaxID=598644 RepID=UPI00105C2B6D|nr:hypothetical protein [Labedaea rhizosphaerae]
MRAKDALGDLTTYDACTVAPMAAMPAKFSRYGTPYAASPYSIDQCRVIVPLAGDHTIDLDWGKLRSMPGPEATKGADLGGGMRLVADQSAATFCVQDLRFADGLAMSIEADAETKSGELCGYTRDVAVVIGKFLRGGGTAGHAIVQQTSLRHKDACSLLPAKLANSVPAGSPMIALEVNPTHHSCQYTNNNAQSIVLEFIDTSADLSVFTDAKIVKVGGRVTARVTETYGDGSTSCRLVTTYTKAPASQYSSQNVEGVAVSIIRRHSSSSLCADATALAGKLWVKLK